jgi:hypothetical protein
MPKENTYQKHETQIAKARMLGNFYAEACARECSLLDDALDDLFLYGYLCSLLQQGVTTQDAELYFRIRRLEPMMGAEQIALQL